MTLDELLKDKPDVLSAVNEAIEQAGKGGTKPKFVDLTEGKYTDVDKYNTLNTKYNDLLKAENPFETKYNELVKTSKNDMVAEKKKLNDIVRKMAVDNAINKLGITDELTKLGIKSAIKMGDIKVDENYNITEGLNEQLDVIKETYKSSFEKPTVINTGDIVNNSLKTGTGSKVYSSLNEIRALSVEEVQADYDNITSQLPNLK